MSLTLSILTQNLIHTAAQRQYKFVLLYLKSGSIDIEIDNEKYQINPGQFITITPKQYYQYQQLNKAEGFVIEFTYDFFCKDEKSMELIYHNGLYCHFGLNEIVNVPDAASKLKSEYYFALLQEEIVNEDFEFEAGKHALLKLLLIELSRYKIKQQKRPLYTPDALFLKFLNLVRDNFSKGLSVTNYAEALFISEAKLNEICKKNTAESPQQLINDLKILEARRLMNYEQLNVKQIAYELGFEDSHYFSRFFKKQTSTRAKDQLRKSIQ